LIKPPLTENRNFITKKIFFIKSQKKNWENKE